MALDWSLCAVPTVFPELGSLLRIIQAGQRIRQVVLTGGDPRRRKTEAELDLSHGHPSRHLQPEIFSRPAVAKEVPASLIVRVNRDLLLVPLVVPEVQRNDVGEQFEIRDR